LSERGNTASGGSGRAGSGNSPGKNGKNGAGKGGAKASTAGTPSSNGKGRRRGGRQRGRGGRGGRWGSEANKRRIDERFFGKKGDAARFRLEERLRAAHGSENFLRTYKEYLKGYGMPDDIPLLLLLLDLKDEGEVLKVLAALDDTAQKAVQEQRSLVRSRLKNLEMSTQSDSLADAAAELLERL
jgi:hypothetical protein